MTAIEWTDATWNPVTGCTKVSPGCAHCYAETFAERFRGVPGHPFEQGFALKLWPERLTKPFTWRKPRKVFVNSMSDLFHEAVPFEFIDRVFAVMALTPQHTYQVLTKRPERMREYLTGEVEMRLPVPNSPTLMRPRSQRIWLEAQGVANNNRSRVDFPWSTDWAWPLPNVWLGTSVENQHWADIRIPELLATPAAVRFLSCEPLLSMLELSHYLSSEAADVTSGERILGPDGSRNVFGGQRGPGMATPTDEQRWQSEGSALGSRRAADPRGERGDAGVSEVAVHSGRGTTSGLRPSDRLDGDESFGHSSAHGGKSHRWGPIEQSPVESRSDHQSGERGSRPLLAGQDRTSEPSRRQAHTSAGGRDPGSLRRKIPASDGDREAVRSVREDGWEHRTEKDLQGDSRLEPRIDWVVVGGESGATARPCDLAWIRSIVAQCKAAGTACFVKQLGAKPYTSDLGALAAPLAVRRSRLQADGSVHYNLRDRKGGNPDEWAEDLRVREWPV